MFDAHCHLDFPEFDEDREAMFVRAREAGVQRFMVPGTTRERWTGVLALAEREGVVVSLGLHPYFVEAHRIRAPRCTSRESGIRDDLDALEQLLSENSHIVGVGECGIDARFEETLAQQWTIFDAQLQLAKRYRLPVVIHCVHANDEVAKRLKQLALPAGGLVHAFGGSPQQAQRFIDLGYTLGLGGAVTYPRARRLQRSVAALPDDAFVLETDSPDMPLCGHQGERNEPARLAAVRDRVAMLRAETPARIEALTTANASRLFDR